MKIGEFTSVILIILISESVSQDPPTACDFKTPFRLYDRSCTNYHDICVKKNDEQCKQLLNSCTQCPPTNITMTMLADLLILMKIQSNFTKEIMNDKIRNMIVQFTSTQQIVVDKLNASSLVCKSTSSNLILIFLGFIIIILIIQFVETRFKLITKCIQNGKHKRSYDYLLFKSRKENILKDKNEKIMKELTDISKNVKHLSHHIKNLSKRPSATYQSTIKFISEDNNENNIELDVHENHSVVQIKQQLWASLENDDSDGYKRMKLKYKGENLDDNDYLLNQINSVNNPVNYTIDPNINISEIVVIKLKSKMHLPNVMQIEQNGNIKNFLSKIFSFVKIEKFIVYKECVENSQMIVLIDKTDTDNNNNNNNGSKVKDFNLIDGDFLHIVAIENGKLKLRSLFNEIDLRDVKYQNIDKISTFSKQISSEMENIILFYRNEKIDEEKLIFQFDISNDSQVKFCQFKKFDGINEGQSIEKYKDWEIYFATNKEKENILIKKYKMKAGNLKSKDWLLNELKTFLITKSNSRFILLNGVYIDNDAFYVSMENMIWGTLRYYLKNNKEFNSIKIVKWASQILEGIDFLHKNNIIHRDLNPSNILVGDSNNIKLSNFNLSKYGYLKDGALCTILGKEDQLYQFKVRYMSPEILESREYGHQCDVWSFGAVLVRIVSGKKPYPKLMIPEAKEKIIKTGIIEYDFPSHKFDIKIKPFIDLCLNKDPNSRSRIKDLIENELIQSFTN